MSYLDRMQWRVQRAALERGQAPQWSWDEGCRRGYAYQGYGLDELLWKLLLAEARRHCQQCGAGDCTHEAARLVLAEIDGQS